MINGISNILTSNSMVNLSQNAAACVSIETAMKAIGRPTFILLDKDSDAKTKKYAATKEFLYQVICLGVYLAVIPSVFKKGSFALAKKFYKGKGFENFKNANEFLKFYKHFLISNKLIFRFLYIVYLKVFLKFYKLAVRNKQDRLQALDKGLFSKFKDKTELIDLIKSDKNIKDELSLQKGVIETGAFIGSILGLTILAPQVSHYILHPIMNWTGLNEKKQENINDNKAKAKLIKQFLNREA